MVLAADMTQLLVGVGKADVTGPAGEVPMMGYGKANQKTGGIHTRLYARAFIFAEAGTAAGKRFLFVNLDTCMVSQALTRGVLSKLKELYGDLYNSDNVAISADHTHSGPGGYEHYVLYQATTLGFVKQSFQALVDGIVEAAVMAHDGLEPGQVYIGYGDLLDASANRSPTAYLNNPQQEREKYSHDTDKRMTLLKIQAVDGRALGSLNWFAVHCTSIGNGNNLISGDNKGMAAQMMEKYFSKNHDLKNFVAGFAQSNEGDVTPNTLGAFCKKTGKACTMDTSTCEGRSQDCLGRGPGYPDEFKSAEIIGRKQWEKAKELFEGATEQVQGPIDFCHTYLDMTNIEVEADEFSPAGKTCRPAMGCSFAAGTTDGPGEFDFTQGQTSNSPFWKTVSSLIKKPSKKQKELHAPKPILLDTGRMNKPYPWQPSIVDVQMLRLGQVVIVCVPGEFTTMAGRRLREKLCSKLKLAWGENLHVVVAGLTNTYSSYVTTYEEYQIQRYEAASNIFGPHALQAYIQVYSEMAQAMVDGKSYPKGTSPPDVSTKQLSFLTPVVYDMSFGRSFGSVLEDVPKQQYSHGDTVEATFRSGNPRNNLRTGDTFLIVEKWNADAGYWHAYLDDDDISTKFYWHKSTRLSGFSTAKIEWIIPDSTPTGKYRLVHTGDAKKISMFGGRRVACYRGESRTFTVK